MSMLHKSVAPTDLKFDDDAGSVTAIFATFDTVDLDGDVTRRGFFGEQQVVIAESHDPGKRVGKGRIFETDAGAVLEGRYFLDTQQGVESYRTAKNLGDLQEWSYGFYLKAGGYSFGEFDGRQVRFLQPLADGSPGVEVSEVSTVLKGAGVDTRTVALKSGQRFVDQAEQVAQAAELLIARAADIHEMRAEKGKGLGDEAVKRLERVASRLESVSTMITDLTHEPAPIEASPLALAAAKRVLVDSQQLLRR